MTEELRTIAAVIAIGVGIFGSIASIVYVWFTRDTMRHPNEKRPKHD